MDHNSFVQAQDTSDGFFFKLSDGTELRLLCELTPAMKMIPRMITKSTSENILVDLDNPSQYISFS